MTIKAGSAGCVALELAAIDGRPPNENRLDVSGSPAPIQHVVKIDIRQQRRYHCILGSLGSGKRAAAIMSLIQSARMNGHDSYAYQKDVLMRFMPTQRASEIGQLLPHQWVPA